MKIEFEKTDFENLEKCPWCNSRNYAFWGKKIRGFISVKCKDCSLIFVKNRLNKNGLVKYYRNYLEGVHQADANLVKQRQRMYELEFELIQRYSKNTNVLDIGCGGGYFLDIFKKHNYDCYGVEFSGAAAQAAAKKHKAYKGDLLEIKLEKKFDLIIFRGVIEHILRPRAYLNKAIRLLNNNGLVYITSTPNSSAFCARLFKENWNQHKPEEHLMHFNSKHFDEYFRTKGFTKILEHNFYEETPYANVEQDILKVSKAIKLARQNKKITFKSPAFWANMLTLIYKKFDKTLLN